MINKIKNKKGSITLFTLISMLFFLIFVIGIYVGSTNSARIQIKENQRIKAIYERDVEIVDQIYDKLVEKI